MDMDWWWMKSDGKVRQMLAVHEENTPVDGKIQARTSPDIQTFPPHLQPSTILPHCLI